MPRYDAKHIGENIKIFRKKNKLSQKQLADLIGVSQTAIYYYESGKREINFETLSKIANVLNTQVLDFLVDEGELGWEIAEYNDAIPPVTARNISISPSPKLAKKLWYEGAERVLQRKILDNYESLNEQGQEKLYDYSCDLLEIEKYRVKDLPRQETTPPEQNNTAPDELLATHQREDIEPTKEGTQQNLDIMNDDSKQD